MCRPVVCKTCKKTTWAGCGSHIASVRAIVPADQWCNGKHSKSEKEAAAAASPSGGWWQRLTNR